MYADVVSTFVLPGNCLLCGQPSHCNLDLCVPCEHELPLLGAACNACAIPMTATGNGNALCGGCLQRQPPQNRSCAAFRYGYPLDHLVQRFKFHADHAAGKLLGQLFAQHVSPSIDAYIALLPVPLHAGRLRERGFNQAELLARSISDRYGCELRTDLLQRTRATAVQSDMNAAARRRNVRDAFAVQAGRIPQHVAIVDDVVTTGSTTREIAALLRKHGVQTIEVWALARTSGSR